MKQTQEERLGEIMAGEPPMTIEEAARLTRWGYITTRQVMMRLVMRGAAARIGGKKGCRSNPMKYRLVDMKERAEDKPRQATRIMSGGVRYMGGIGMPRGEYAQESFDRDLNSFLDEGDD